MLCRHFRTRGYIDGGQIKVLASTGYGTVRLFLKGVPTMWGS